MINFPQKPLMKLFMSKKSLTSIGGGMARKGGSLMAIYFSKDPKDIRSSVDLVQHWIGDSVSYLEKLSKYMHRNLDDFPDEDLTDDELEELHKYTSEDIITARDVCADVDEVAILLQLTKGKITRIRNAMAWCALPKITKKGYD